MNRKLFFTLALVGAFVSVQPSLAATEVYTNVSGANGASYNSITGGSIATDGTTCTVNVNSGVAGATANWQHLNVPQANTLNFYFPDGGQYALNKVSSGVSRIAGNVGYASGSQAGTVIISNPNGVLCSGTSVINMGGSLLLTTHNINSIDEVNKVMSLSSTKGLDGVYHGVTVMPGATMTLGGNLTIASLGIDMNGANITSKDAILVTSDGLNYVLADSGVTGDKITNVTSADTQPNSVYYNNMPILPTANIEDFPKTKVANTAIKTTDGKIIIKSNAGDVTVASSKFDGDTDLVAAKNVNVTSSSTMANDGTVTDETKGAFLGNVNISAGENVTMTSVSKDTVVPLYKDLTVNAGGDVTLKNVRIVNNFDQNANLTGNNITISNYDTSNPDWSNTILGNLVANATNDFTAVQTQLQGNNTITAGNDINSYGSLIGATGKTSTLNAKNITIDKGPIDGYQGFIARVRGTLNATADESITLANNFKLESESPDAVLSSPSVTIDNFSLKSTSIQDVESLTIADNTKIFGDLSITGAVDGDNNNLLDLAINKITVNGNLTTNNVDDMSLTNSTVNGDYTANNINDLTMLNDVINGNVVINPAGNATVNGSTVTGDFTAQNISGNLGMDDDTIGGNVITGNVTGNVNLTDSNITGDYTAQNIGGDLYMDNDTINGNVVIDPVTGNVTANNSKVDGDFTAQNIGGNLGMDDDIIGGNVITGNVAGDVSLTDSKITGDYTAQNVGGDLYMDNDTINGNVVIDPVTGNVTANNSKVDGDFTAQNIDGNLNMNNDTVGGNIYLDTISKVVAESVNGGDTMYINNISDWSVDDNSNIINGIVLGNNVQSDASSQQQGVNNSTELSAYVDTLDVGSAPSFDIGGGQFSPRAFAAGDDDDDDYKEEFLRNYVREDKDGNLYTINTFKGE